MRRPHYLASNKANQLPSNCIWFDTETSPELNEAGEELHSLDFGYAAYRRRKQSLHWCAPEWKRFTTKTQFWDWIVKHCRERTRLYLFAHNGQFDLPVLDAFVELPKRGFVMKNAIVESPPLMVTWKRGRETIRFVDTLNIWRVPLEELGKSIDLPKLSMPGKGESRRLWDEYGKRDTEIIMEACINWFEFIRKHDLGGFSYTLASQSFNAYRHRFMPKKIFIDNNERSTKLARLSFLGGRTECFKIGEYKGEFYHLDINSMYPFVMGRNEFPFQLVGAYSRTTLPMLTKWIEQYCVVADVELETKQPIYPQVINGKLCFPVGRLRVQLATPELRHALEHGQIKKIYLAVLYKKADLFSEFVDFVWHERRRASAEGNELESWFIKIFGNSLFGKWGQRGRHYEKHSAIDDLSIRVWTEVNAQSLEVKHFRQFGGMLQHWVDKGEAQNSFPAIAAHITSQARLTLWELIDSAKRRNVYYCDTDCIVTNRAGFDNVSNRIDPDILGGLKIEGRYKHIKLYGPKDYEFDSIRRVKGVRRKAKWLDENTVEQVQFVGFKGLLRRASLDCPIVRTQLKRLARVYDKGRVVPSGRVLPFRVCDW